MPRCRSLSHPFDPALARMLKVYVATGLFFMLFPGTLVGVMTLVRISNGQSSHAAGTAWVQAHGHAQLFGWLGTFILGVGFYAIPRLRLSRYSAGAAWTVYALWTAGVTMRWAAGSYPWHWRFFFPAGAILEVIAAAVFVASVYLPKPEEVDATWRTSVKMITIAGWSIVAALLMNAYEAVAVAIRGNGPLFPAAFNRSFLVVATWGFVVPFVWAFATRWVPPLMGLRRTRKELCIPALLLLLAGVAMSAFGFAVAGDVVIVAASILYIYAARLFEPAEKEPKLRGVHPSTLFFIRSAFVWLLVAAGIAIAADAIGGTNGYVGSSRHALTVGFLSIIVFTIAPRVLPGFFGIEKLFSRRLMFASLLLLSVGCTIRVVSQALAYQHIAEAAWKWLPVSAVIEMVAVGIFAVNMAMTLALRRSATLSVAQEPT